MSHSLKVVEKKAFSMGVGEVFDDAAVRVRHEVGEDPIQHQDLSATALAQLPQLEPGFHRPNSERHQAPTAKPRPKTIHRTANEPSTKPTPSIGQ